VIRHRRWWAFVHALVFLTSLLGAAGLHPELMHQASDTTDAQYHVATGCTEAVVCAFCEWIGGPGQVPTTAPCIERLLIPLSEVTMGRLPSALGWLCVAQPRGRAPPGYIFL
jgi:hypothetical protein